MDIGELLVADGVVLRGGMSSKRQALHAVAEAAAPALAMSPQRLVEALNEDAGWTRWAYVPSPAQRRANSNRSSSSMMLPPALPLKQCVTTSPGPRISSTSS